MPRLPDRKGGGRGSFYIQMCVKTVSAELTAAGLTKGIATKEKRTSYFDNRFHGVDYMMFAIGGVGMVLIIGGLI